MWNRFAAVKFSQLLSLWVIFFSSWFLNSIFTDFRILVWQFLYFNTLKMVFFVFSSPLFLIKSEWSLMLLFLFIWCVIFLWMLASFPCCHCLLRSVSCYSSTDKDNSRYLFSYKGVILFWHLVHSKGLFVFLVLLYINKIYDLGAFQLIVFVFLTTRTMVSCRFPPSK